MDDMMADVYSAMEGANARVEDSATISHEVVGDMKVEEGAVAIASSQPTEQMFGGSRNSVLDAPSVSCFSSACLLRMWLVHVCYAHVGQAICSRPSCLHAHVLHTSLCC